MHSMRYGWASAPGKSDGYWTQTSARSLTPSTHDWMLEFLRHRIADKRILRLINKWLKAGIIEDGKRIAAERGTPQGAVISPLLANIYLPSPSTPGRSTGASITPGATSSWCATPTTVFSDASTKKKRSNSWQTCGNARRNSGWRYTHRKTRLIEFGPHAERRRKERGLGRPETFDFLGFTHCCAKTLKGKFKILRLTVKKRMRATLAAIGQH